jgi:hypothetical protein
MASFNVKTNPRKAGGDWGCSKASQSYWNTKNRIADSFIYERTGDNEYAIRNWLPAQLNQALEYDEIDRRNMSFFANTLEKWAV